MFDGCSFADDIISSTGGGENSDNDLTMNTETLLISAKQNTLNINLIQSDCSDKIANVAIL